VPVKYASGPFADGWEPTRLMYIAILLVIGAGERSHHRQHSLNLA
jgi:hypothetical protein